MKFDKLYYDPKSPAGHAGEQALYKLARKSSKTVKLKDVRNWLKKQQTYIKLYYFVVYLYVNGSGSITSVGEERAYLSAVIYL